MKKRVISAIIALIIIIPLVIIGGYAYYAACGILGVIGFYELITLKDKKKNIPLIIKIISFLSFVYLMMSGARSNNFIIHVNIFSFVMILMLVPIIFFGKSKRYNSSDALYLLSCVLFLGLGFNSLLVIRNIGINYLLYIAIITIMSDTFAHFFGTKIGKYKLCPYISPNKTIEGMLGGTFFGTFLGSMFFNTIINNDINLLLVIGVTLILSLIAQCGDLVFSAIKREYEVKDYGNIMPGHGGVLDRLDSILLASLAFNVIVVLL